MKLKILAAVNGIFCFQLSLGDPNSRCQGNLIGWKREFYDSVIVDNKKIPLPPSDTVRYRLFILQLNPSCTLKVSALPAFIDEKKKDTSYSASDGGFMYGTGFAHLKDSLMEIRGKYNKLRYIRTNSDSTFEFDLSRQGKGYMENGIKTYFQWVTDAKVAELKSRWGM